MKRIWKFGLLSVAVLFAPLVYSAEALKGQEAALEVIGNFADRFCTQIPLKGNHTNAEVTGEIRAEIRGLLKKLADLGLEGHGSYQRSEFQGVLQQDLLGALQNSTQCKLKVWADLKDRLIPARIEGHPRASHLNGTPQPSLTQGPGSIAQIGGTGNIAIVNNNAPPDAGLTARYDTQSAQNVDGSVAYQGVITINTDRTVVGPQITITCDAPCAFKSMGLGVDALMGTNRQANDNTVEIGLNQALRPDQTLTVLLNAKGPFHIVSIKKM